MQKPIPLLAKTSFGFENLLVEELKSFGATDIRPGIRAVSFTGDLELMYSVNMNSRVALRILMPLRTFPARNEQQLYDELKKIDWSEYMSVEDTLAVDAVTVKSNLTHSLYVSLKTKDAVVDQFREKFSIRPNVDLRFPTIRINVHLSNNIATVSLDSSGDSLHKRGYRVQQGEAPLNETLAAGMLMLSGWDRASPLTDIMCGSGTILIEAAWMARNIAPGLLRKEFGFERWKNFDTAIWEKIITRAKDNCKERIDFEITGIDQSSEAVKNARENAVAAGVGNDIRFHTMLFEGYEPTVPTTTIVTNPPYGGRITDNNLFALYSTMGDHFKKKFSGGTAWVLTANQEAAKHIGLHASKKIQLYNGALECRFLKFELYGGSRKKNKEVALKNNDNEV